MMHLWKWGAGRQLMGSTAGGLKCRQQPHEGDCEDLFLTHHLHQVHPAFCWLIFFVMSFKTLGKPLSFCINWTKGVNLSFFFVRKKRCSCQSAEKSRSVFSRGQEVWRNWNAPAYFRVWTQVEEVWIKTQQFICVLWRLPLRAVCDLPVLCNTELGERLSVFSCWETLSQCWL